MGLYKRGKTWFIDYRYPPGRQGKRIREKVGPSKEEAQIILSTRLRNIREGLNPELRRIAPKPFREMVDEFLDRHAKKLKSYKSLKLNTDLLLQYFGEMTLQEITPKVIEDYINARIETGVAKSTTNRQRACLSAIFKCAIQWDYYRGENPVKKVKAFQESPSRFRFLSGDEASRLFAHMPDHLRQVSTCALYSGGRLSEVLSLRWSDVRGDTVHFDKTNSKSGKGREVPIHPELAAVLQERRRLRFRGGDAREYIFTWRGKRIRSVRTAFNAAREDAGLGEDVTFHMLRHTFASWYMINGGDLYRLKKYLGHSTIELTQRYAHLSAERIRDGVSHFGAPREIGGHTLDTNDENALESAPASS